VSNARHSRDGEPETIEEVRAQRDQLAAELVAALAQLDRLGASFPVTADGTGPLPAVPPQRTRSHRAARPTHLRRIKVLIPVAFTGGLGALRWAWHAHRVATVAAGVFTAAAVTAGTAAVAPHVPVLSSIASGPAATVPGWHTTATPILSPSAVARAASRAGLDAKSSRKSTPPVVDPPDPVPSASTRPSPVSSPVSYSPPAPSPLLSLSTSQLDLGVLFTGTVQLSNAGPSVQWSATCSADVSLMPSQGWLAAGQQGFPVVVRIDPVDGASQGNCTFTGGLMLIVTWAGPGSPSAAAG
jgi:hypothetical protein